MSTPRPPDIRVAVHENWRDFEDALRFLTPGGAGSWNGVHYAPAAQMPDPDYVLVLNMPQDTISVTCPPERLWFACGEPPTPAHLPLHLGQGEGTVVLTCSLALAANPPAAIRRTFIATPPMLRSWHVHRSFDQLSDDERPDTAAPPKTAILSWVTSAQSLLPGHRRRLEFLEALRRRVPFDLFGRGFHPIADKWDGIAPYRYSIAFENSMAPWYFSEKVMDCFVAQTMPIYFGTPRLGDFFPAGSFIQLDANDPAVFDRILDIIASDRWVAAQAPLREARRLVLRRYNVFARLARMMRQRLAPPSPPMPFVVQRIRQARAAG